MRQIAVVVEGHGDAEAAPVLCRRILLEVLNARDWTVQREGIRQPRSQLVDESVPSPARPAHASGLERALAIALARPVPPDAVLILCDADDDCPAAFGRTCPCECRRRDLTIAVRGVMACREFESWFLWQRRPARDTTWDPECSPRDAKGELRSRLSGYTVRIDQVELVRLLKLRSVWSRSDSFDKLVRSIADLIGRKPPTRPRHRR